MRSYVSLESEQPEFVALSTFIILSANHKNVYQSYGKPPNAGAHLLPEAGAQRAL
jgi:hypothetical protein